MSRLVRAEDVGAVDDGALVYVAALPDGPIYVLADDAAALWREAEAGALDAVEPDGHARALLDAGLLTIEKDT